MKTHKQIYKKLCEKSNLIEAYEKAKKGKTKKIQVIEFTQSFEEEIDKLHQELISFTYSPLPLRRFIVRDPKSRVIHASAFRDRIVHHAIINLIGPIFEKSFIYDSHASRLNKGTHLAVSRFDSLKRKVSRNGRQAGAVGGVEKTSYIQGYCLKADIKKYFNNIDHNILINILKRKIKDEKVILLIKKVLSNFENEGIAKGMPLGNYTSQFFANVYLNEFDYFVKHILKARYYIRYVDDFVILHKRKKVLELHKERIKRYLKVLNLELHPDKSAIIPLHKGTTFLGYKIFYHYKLLRKRNFRTFKRKYEKRLQLYKDGLISKKDLMAQLEGWFGYAQWANTYKVRKKILAEIKKIVTKNIILLCITLLNVIFLF